MGSKLGFSFWSSFQDLFFLLKLTLVPKWSRFGLSKPNKKLLTSICFYIYFSAPVLLNTVDKDNYTPLKKIIFAFANGCQLQIGVVVRGESSCLLALIVL